MLRLCLLCLCLLLPGVVAAQDREIEALARETLSGLQEKSIRQSREYCGLIGRDAKGALVVGTANRGTRARCRSRRLPRDVEPVASYHTHGGFLANYDNEVPSLLDLETEMSWGLTGFVATPGGRFWKVDGKRGEVRLICGPRCLPWDSRYDDNDLRFGKVKRRFSRDQLHERGLAGPGTLRLCDGLLCTD